jgi:hypothetical protein
MPRFVSTVLVCALLVVGASAPAAQSKLPGQDQSYVVVREGDQGLADHTILRPKDLASVPFQMPIVAWANGGCRDSNEEYHYFLTHFASYGFFLIANGPPGNAYHPEELTGLLAPNPQKLIDSINWAVRENRRPASQYFHRLDINRIAIMGQSCGGWEALRASSDRRVKTTVVWNSASSQDPQAAVRSVLALHAPTIWVTGGPADFTVPAQVDYEIAPSSVPAIRAVNSSAGHVGFWDAPSEYLDEPLIVGANWLRLTLYNSPDARAFLLGPGCGLCKRANWETVESKNWETFKPRS